MSINLSKEFGVYEIRNLVNGMKYIGSTKKNFNNRWKQWRYCLRKNRAGVHRYLQNAWNKYGESNFEFVVLETVNSIDLVLEREQYWIDNSDNLYNLAKKVVGTRACKENREKLIPNSEHQNIIDLYLEGASLSIIAKSYSCSVSPIKDVLKNNNIQLRGNHDFSYTEESKLKMKLSHLGKSSSKKGIRQSRLCICGKPVSEYYTRDGRFNGYNLTCGDKLCILESKRETRR